MAYTGTVASFGASKGYGFISGCDQLGSDVFFGRVALPPELKEVAGRQVDLRGRRVLFDLNPHDQSGKPVASCIRLVASEGEICTGYVRSYDPPAGTGWIESTSLDAAVQFGIANMHPQQQGREPRIDGLVAFALQMMSDGTFEARDLQLIEEEGKGKGKGSFSPDVPIPPPPTAPHPLTGVCYGPSSGGAPPPPPTTPHPLTGACYGPSATGAPQAQARGGQRLQGIVLSYNHAKGWGFLRCSSVQGDCFFKGDGQQQITDGMTLHFTLFITPDGKPQARDIAAGLVSGQQYMATITSWSNRNGWGFFTVPVPLSDVYFQRRVLPPDMQQVEELKGAHAYITVMLTPDGKPKATGADFMDSPPPGYAPPLGPAGGRGQQFAPSPAPAPSAAVSVGYKRPLPQTPPPPPPKRIRPPQPGEGGEAPPIEATGTVVTYNPVKGFGFLQSAESTAGDVFFGRASLGPELQGLELQGRQMTFQLVYTPEGKPQARECCLI